MNSLIKIVILFTVSFIFISLGYFLLFDGQTTKMKISTNDYQVKIESNDTIVPYINYITGNTIGNTGSTIIIQATFFDNFGVTSAKLYYKPAIALAWSTKSIITGSASINLPANSNESWFYYVTIDDAAGNGPIGDPSSDGSSYYTITVFNTSINSINNIDNNKNNKQNYSRFVFIELGTKIVCSECPKVSTILNDLYNSGEYPFYYVSLPQDNPKAMARINDYNIWGYPTVYIDGGYTTLIGSNIQKSDFEKNIISASKRATPLIFINSTANLDKQTNIISIGIQAKNHETTNYQGRLRVYITELISTKWQAGTPIHFSLLNFLINEDVEIFANNHIFINKTFYASDLDPENIMIFSVLFSASKNTGYSQIPEKNPFEAHYVDAVCATRVIQGGNLPPEIGIQNPSVKYLHLFGNPVRKTLTGKTIVLGKTTIIASVHDDSQIKKVEFYIDNELKITINKDPYQWTWHMLSFGKKTITIKAFDDSGKQSTASIDVFAFIL